MSRVTPELVANAYAALMSGDRNEIGKYWAEDMRWYVPGHNMLSGWKTGLNAFLGFMRQVGELSGNSFRMDNICTTTSDEYSADVTRNRGQCASIPAKQLDITAVHVLRWRDGKVIEGRGAIMGDGTAQYDQFWSPV
ncbi:nuclear transport factor 2 family protein [Corallococcus llansteffanensis]|uniref:Nuclear transport factor 2 family protein n=1 Tax=Corallococcus llansteffanensis TaxID=2316731 RepID=A0A3A8PW82_9BACT|nr:nuclear transport factor 2 family protein [Corallococcus llansteffanensis]RKH59290.1 nuclear transport factor 2 family protein [Corallococcus llansteffanensis]